jgi:hypothetical protein
LNPTRDAQAVFHIPIAFIVTPHATFDFATHKAFSSIFDRKSGGFWRFFGAFLFGRTYRLSK